MKISAHRSVDAGRHFYELEQMLSESPAATRERERDAFWQLADRFDKEFVIFGAGQLGAKVAHALRRHGIEPIAFADNNTQLWGRSINGIPVTSPADAAMQWGQRAAFLLAVWPSRAADTYADRRKQLEGLGCIKVIPFLSLLWTDPEAYLPHFSLAAPHDILADAPLLRRCMGLWGDQASADAFLGILRWRTLADFSGLPPKADYEQYFPNDLYTVGPGDTLVDCGAFDGDTVRAFFERVGEADCRVIALEPDPNNFEALKTYAASLGVGNRSITAFPYAVGRRRETLSFSATGTETAAVTSAGSLTVKAVPLDELLSDESPSLIKMDIEGFELEALAGSVEVIRRARPVLAIAAYHLSDHLWKIPLAIAAAANGARTPAANQDFDSGPASDYSFFLRSYQNDFWETVCYAIPSRLLNS
jgi:FkbM family methyltransferase